MITMNILLTVKVEADVQRVRTLLTEAMRKSRQEPG